MIRRLSRQCDSVRLADAYGEYAEPKWPNELRCGECGKLLAELVNAPFRVMCPRCRNVNEPSS